MEQGELRKRLDWTGVMGKVNRLFYKGGALEITSVQLDLHPLREDAVGQAVGTATPVGRSWLLSRNARPGATLPASFGHP